MLQNQHIAILGGGPAGLSVGYYAKKNGIKFKIYEASNRVGGNCITLKYKDFSFDSGAHRLHDKNEHVTTEIKKLLGEELQLVHAQSQIYCNEKLIDFPLTPLDLLTKLGVFNFFKAGVSYLKSRVNKVKLDDSFQSLAIHNYGRTIAELFLLNYSEKLWGLSCDKLSQNISGSRLKGLNLKTFLIEAIKGKKAKTKHLDGSFYYPKSGYGTIVEEMANFCNHENICLNSRISKVIHDQTKIKAIEVKDQGIIDVDEVVSSLPLSLFLNIMEPKPPEEILTIANSLSYRHIRLIALFLDKQSVNKNATMYFPEIDFPFTRIYEPRNRSTYMSPPGKTSLVVELPCHLEDHIWQIKDEELIKLVQSKLIEIDLIKQEEIIDSWTGRMSYAYPILELGFEDKLKKITTWLNNFSNLKVSGRNGKFAYTHLHDMMIFGKDIIDEYIGESADNIFVQKPQITITNKKYVEH